MSNREATHWNTTFFRRFVFIFSYIIDMYTKTIHFGDDAWKLSMGMEMSSPKGKRVWIFKLILRSQVTTEGPSTADCSGQTVLKDSLTKCTRNG